MFSRSARTGPASFAALAVVALEGCIPALNLVPVQPSASKQGTITIDFTAATNTGKPVTDLTADAFSIYEDGSKVLRFSSKATSIDARTGEAHYALAYCTEARGGVHEVRVDAHAPDGLMGELTYHYDAEGFGPGCDPNNPTAEHVAVTSTVAAAPEKKKDIPKKPRPRPASTTTTAPAPPAPKAPTPPPAGESTDPFAP